jgi:GAF domain
VKRHRATSRKPAKAQQTIKGKRGAAPKSVRNHPSGSSKGADIARLTRERDEAIEREKATAEVLRVISNSAGELAPVFNSMLANAVRLCAASFGNLYLRDGEFFRLVAFHNTPTAFVAQRRAQSYRPGPNAPPNRMLRTRAPVHVADLTADPSYVDRDPGVVAFVELAGTRTVLLVPMLKDGEPIGYLSTYRHEVQPFTEEQIALLTNFAGQAVIAIENARLLSELRQRTDDLTEALQQQTAISEVLQVISSSQGELESVFQAMLDNATRLCGAAFGLMFLHEEDAFRLVAMHNAPPAFLICGKENYRLKCPNGFSPLCGLFARVFVGTSPSHAPVRPFCPVPRPPDSCRLIRGHPQSGPSGLRWAQRLRRPDASRLSVL